VTIAVDALPERFVQRMRDLLGAELDAFLAALAQPRSRALRVNPTKTNTATLRTLLGVELRQLPWCPQGITFPAAGPPISEHHPRHQKDTACCAS
jgi:16S rRNA C967 or C1407 C5-methylase (RsmB/RsmF family)